MRVLFLGEGSSDGSARYLAAILSWARIPFDHRPDRARLPNAWRQKRYDAVILSDYRSSSWTPWAREWLTQAVVNGCGLMMLGGWASFTGQVGHYAGSDIEILLPVRCKPGDDRVNAPALLTNGRGTSVLVNGFHRVRALPGSQTQLLFREVHTAAGKLTLGAPHPALVTGLAGAGRTCAFMTDCAPHWAGGLIDWGPKRVRIAVGGNIVEVGERYLKFFKKWILWTAHKVA